MLNPQAAPNDALFVIMLVEALKSTEKSAGHPRRAWKSSIGACRISSSATGRGRMVTEIPADDRNSHPDNGLG